MCESGNRRDGLWQRIAPQIDQRCSDAVDLWEGALTDDCAAARDVEEWATGDAVQASFDER